MRIRIRPANSADYAYVCSSWLAGWAQDSRLPRKQIDRAAIDRIVTNPRTMIRLAEDADDGRIVGFTVGTGDVLHYVHVRREHWGFGVCRALLKGQGPYRCWYVSRALKFVARCCELRFDPLALLGV